MCFASKAVHLELVSDLSTAACIAAIRRFVSRKGCPKNLYSDNGKNFIGSEEEIADLQKILRNEHCDSLQAEAATLNSSTSKSDTNYNIALTLLKDRYENKRSIIQAHLQAIW